jgi:hypothetical protein
MSRASLRTDTAASRPRRGRCALDTHGGRPRSERCALYTLADRPGRRLCALDTHADRPRTLRSVLDTHGGRPRSRRCAPDTQAGRPRSDRNDLSTRSRSSIDGCGLVSPLHDGTPSAEGLFRNLRANRGCRSRSFHGEGLRFFSREVSCMTIDNNPGAFERKLTTLQAGIQNELPASETYNILGQTYTPGPARAEDRPRARRRSRAPGPGPPPSEPG